MNKIKNIWLLLLAAATTFSSCERGDYVAPEATAKSFGIVSSVFLANGRTLSVGVPNDMLAYRSMANGYLTHNWSVMTESIVDAEFDGEDWEYADEHVHFIKTIDGYPPTDDTDNDYSPYYDDSKSCNNYEDLTIVFIVDTPGRYKVSLYASYAEVVYYTILRKIDVTYVQDENYIERLQALPSADGTCYEAQLDMELVIFTSSLSKQATLYTDDTYTEELVLTMDDLQIDSDSTEDNSGDPYYYYEITVGDTLYFKEDGYDTQYGGSSGVTWSVSTGTADNVQMEYEDKVTGDYNCSKLAATFWSTGNYKISMYQERVAPVQFEDYGTYGTTVYPSASSTTVVTRIWGEDLTTTDDDDDQAYYIRVVAAVVEDTETEE